MPTDGSYMQPFKQVFFLVFEHMFHLGKTCCVAVNFDYAGLSIVTDLLERAYESSRRICSTQASDEIQFLRQSRSLRSAHCFGAYY